MDTIGYLQPHQCSTDASESKACLWSSGKLFEALFFFHPCVLSLLQTSEGFFPKSALWINRRNLENSGKF
jgi:hypothetical protein